MRLDYKKYKLSAEDDDDDSERSDDDSGEEVDEDADINIFHIIYYII